MVTGINSPRTDDVVMDKAGKGREKSVFVVVVVNNVDCMECRRICGSE